MAQISTSSSEKIILGIDPGTRFLGYGLLRITNDKVTVLQYGVLNLTKYTTQGAKFLKIHERVLGILEEFLPDEIAIESPFFGKNVQSMLKLGRVQGMVMSLAFSKSIPIAEYEPKKIKQSVTGNGNASKEQVAKMVEIIGNIKLDAKMHDATDALGIAICHHFHNKNISSTLKGTKKGWGAFVTENPERIK
ncbi:crossover junction endodeoxyribonuclease RuvC [Aquirufa antheringensis]|jgi:crossover junction endodeoxyribonuclease RuvC|uniref:Crossover junction endodeoxyribonuclease RuvC n=1 Tax=Aquirufa antheringensis TaxID=2516559 RepID=A0A4Q9BBM7_9BACT|nr:crossover junction endodeoxyribonuclease RuvC [Aquirufa antheringensis]MCE4216488.1 crossover junction endodeoxyribonuclease RuvC [Pseudarcicella sp. GAP-15]MCL9968548.1 crossover junction endodeoxyribonuclease RuvC [Aquirufa antheringensis]MCZ2476802.1 crossover junction endodeoxyribonuclease RuvC [Aquirufa antheringensis]MCZ2485984.1 crossover junction endodeoxyribonuclease RuvC [Aquirufa antheringensis]MCZ2486325.1 crossover junction endodeoxyribonuclease RuvC [Aquirufa antheringensis]